MTCIIAVEHDGKVYMGADSSCLAGFEIEIDKKVFEVGEFLIGHSGYTRFAQIIEFGLSLPERVDGESDMRYIVSRLVPAIRECTKQHGYTVIDNNAERTEDSLLMGYRGKIYQVESNFAVTCASRGYTAIGCGANFALGAYSVFDGYEFSDSAFPLEEKIKAALKISGNFCAGVLPPYYVLSK